MAQQEVLNISLRDYKKEIESLKGTLLGLDRESQEYAKTLSDLQAKQQKLNQVTRDAKRDDDALEGSYNALVASMARLKEEWRATNDIAKRNELGLQIESINTQLKELDFSIGNSQRNVGNYEGATVSLKQQLRELNETMTNMLASGIKETDPAFVELAKKAGSIKDAMMDAKAATKEYADDVRGMTVATDVVKNLAASYGAVTSAMELFGASTEDAQKITAKMTTVMTLLNSVSAINKAINDSASPTRKLLISLWQQLTGAKQKDIVATTQSTAAEVANNATVNAGTVAMEANKVATEGATVATNGFKKALISTGIGAIVVLIGTLIAKWDDLCSTVKGWLGLQDKEIKKQKELAAAEKRRKDALEKQKFEYESTTKVVAELDNKMEILKMRIKDAGDDINKQRVLLADYHKDFKFLNVSVKNYGDLRKKIEGEITAAMKKYKDARVAEKKAELQAMRVAELQYRKDNLEALRKVLTEELNMERQKQNKALKMRLQELEAVWKGQTVTPAVQATMNQLRKEIDATSGLVQIKGGNVYNWLKDVNAQLNTAQNTLDGYNKEFAEALNNDPSALNSGGSGGKGGKNIPKAVDPLKEAIEQSKADLDELKNVLENVFSLYENNMKVAEKDYKEKTRNTKSEKERLETEEEYLKERLRIMAETTNVYEQMEKSLYDYNPMLGRNYEDVDVTPEIKKLFDKVKTLREEDLLALSTALKQADDKMVEFLEDNDNRLYENSKKRREQAIADAKYMVSYLDNMLSLDESRYNNAYDKAEIGKSEQETVELEKQRQKALYDLRKESLEKQLRLSEETLKIMTPETEAYKEQALAIENLKAKLEALNIAEIKRTTEAQKNTKKNIQVYTQWGNAIASIMSTVVSAQQNQLQKELDNKEISQKEAEERFENMKKFQIAATVIETLAGATATFMLTAADKSIQPTFVRMATASLLAANTLAQGYAQINQIKSTTLGGASSSLGGGAYNSGSNIATAPLLNPTLDSLSLQNIQVGQVGQMSNSIQNQRVYILEQDIQKSNKRVEVREHSTTF